MTTLKDQILRHQLLLMRLIRTQASRTKSYLKKAESIMLTAVKTKNYNNLFIKLQQALQYMPQQAVQLINELAVYEAKFTASKIKKVKPDVVKLTEQQVDTAVKNIKIKTSTTSTPLLIPVVYTQFVKAKTQQYTQLAADIQTQDMDEEEAVQLIKERTNGLFSTQNLALAGLAIMSTSNNIRAQVAKENLMQVNWVLKLELNNCPDCEDMADGSPYNFEDVDGMIQMHVNCGCALVPVFDALDE